MGIILDSSIPGMNFAPISQSAYFDA